MSGNFCFSFLFGCGNGANEVETKEKIKITRDNKLTTTYISYISTYISVALAQLSVCSVAKIGTIKESEKTVCNGGWPFISPFSPKRLCSSVLIPS